MSWKVGVTGYCRSWIILILPLALGALLPQSAYAARRARLHKARYRSSAPAPTYRAALLEDADSGAVLYQENADMQWPPASMAKMMLLLVAYEQVKAGRFSLNDPVRISERAGRTGGSRLGLDEGQVYPLGELMKAALMRSANDAAVAVAEKIAGSVEACVRLMNKRAGELGMRRTAYGTVDGLPPRPSHDVDVTDSYDLATVARALIRETNLLKWSELETAPFDGGLYMLRNTNHLVGHLAGCDGLKTGFTFRSGFNLTATAKRGNMRLIAVILGAPSNRQRFAQAARLLEWGFERYTSVALLKTGEPLPVQVQVRPGPVIRPVVARDVSIVLPKTDISSVQIQYRVPPAINAPVASGERLGEIVVEDRGEILDQVGVLSPVAIPVDGTVAGAPFYDGAAAVAEHRDNQ